MTWVRGAHHVLGIKHLLCKFRNCQCAVLLRSTRSEGREAGHEEMQAWKWDQVDSNLTKIAVELTWKAQAASDATDGRTHEVVEVTVCWCCELQGPEANVIQGLVIEEETFVRVLHELVERKDSVVWFDDCIGHFWRWNDRECLHDTVWVFFTDFRDKQCTHACTGTTTKRVHQLETLKAITSLSFLAHHVQDRVNQLGALSVVPLSPVISRSCLSEDKVIRAEKLSKWTSPHTVHGSWLKIHKDGTWNVAASSGLVEVNIDALKLKVRISVVSSCGVDSMFIADDLPKLCTDLVTALAALHVDKLAHDC